MSKEPLDRQEPHFAPRGLAQLRYALTTVPGRLAALSRERADRKLTTESWSAKEELGHLIDSAANNHQRIVRAQLEDNLALPGYDGDRWVELHGYQNREWNDLIALWRAGNLPASRCGGNRARRGMVSHAQRRRFRPDDS